jgi:death-on-curing protein
MKSLSIDQVLALHEELIRRYGGALGLRDRGQLESALAQPFMTFAGEQLYSDLPEKAAALCFSLVKNHPFVDGNKRVGYAVLRFFLRSNGVRIVATADEKVSMTLSVADGSLSRAELIDWIRAHTIPIAGS